MITVLLRVRSDLAFRWTGGHKDVKEKYCQGSWRLLRDSNLEPSKYASVVLKAILQRPMLLQSSCILLNFTTFPIQAAEEIFLKVKQPRRETHYQLHELESRMSGAIPPFPYMSSWFAHVRGLEL